MAQKPTFDYDIIVIGSGAGGSPAATIAARAGKRVAVIEKSEFGGESPNWGEIPRGALLHAVHVYDTAKQGASFGLRSNTIGYNYPSLLSWRDAVVKRTGAAGNRNYYEKQGISVFNNAAHFLSPNEISVNRRHLSARRFLIATGSTWVVPEIPGLAETPHHTPETILSLSRPPKSLFVVGSNTTAVEIASFFAILGTKVYITESATRILPEYDSEVGELFTEQLQKQRGMTLLPSTKVVATQKDGLSKRITYLRGGSEHTVKVDELLIADKRAPVTDLGLENAGVAYSIHGITVDETLQTSARHIFAAGSCVNVALTTSDILAESRIAAHNVLRNKRIQVDMRIPLHTTNLQPDVARVGFTEDDCIRRDLSITTAIAPLSLVPISNVTDQRLGFVKLIADKKGTLLGATIVAPHANEMIHELALALQHNMTARDVFMAPHSFTSWSEAIRIAASKLL